MGQAFLHGNGGASSLNFKVVGGTSAPSNPKENTIWINTSTTITSYVFSTTEPTEPLEGMVWFLTGKSSTAEFNAIKKNRLQVYPSSAKQYIGGAWVDKPTKIYRDDAWGDVKFATIYLVENGKLKVTLINYSTSGATMTITEDSAGYVSIKGNKEGYHAWHVKVDLTGYKTMAVKTAASSGATTANCLCVWPLTQQTPKYDNASAKVRLQATGTVTVDVSSLDGEYFVGVTSSTSNKVNIADWRLEI